MKTTNRQRADKQKQKPSQQCVRLSFCVRLFSLHGALGKKEVSFSSCRVSHPAAFPRAPLWVAGCDKSCMQVELKQCETLTNLKPSILGAGSGGVVEGNHSVCWSMLAASLLNGYP